MPDGCDNSAGGLAARLGAVRERLARAARAAGRRPEEITLVGVTKTVPAARISAALGLGLTELGENRVQEARDKIAAMPGARWHLIGHLQSNKARLAAQLFPVIQSVDSPGLAAKLARLAGELGKTLEVFAQVNTSGEASKSGLAPGEADRFFAAVAALPNLRWRGLMTIGPLTEDERAARAAFAQLRELRERLARQYPALPLAELSMGMTDDCEWAIAEGATMVRVGRAIFGDRQ